MTEKCIANLCRMCMNESHSYSPIYEEICPDNSMLFEVINDVCQLEVTMGDELPRYICSDCSFKLSEFRKLKMRSHEVQASLQRLKENILNLYLDIPGESSLTGNRVYIKVDVETQDSFDHASGRVESFEEYIGIEPDDCHISTVEMEKHDVKTTTCDPLYVYTKTEIEDPLCLDEDVNDVSSDKEQELDLKETYLPSRTAHGDASEVTNQAHEKIAMNILKAIKGKKLFGMKLLSGNIEERKTIDNPEEGTSYGARRPLPCSNNECVNFAGIQNLGLENQTNENLECNACRENLISTTVIDKPEFHYSGGETLSNLSQLEVIEDDDYIHKLFRIHGMPITRPKIIGSKNNVSKCGDLKKGKKCSKNGDLKIKRRRRFSKSVVHDDIMHLMDDRKRFCCDICGRGFLGKVPLKEHITIHTGERNFQCPVCKKCFARKRDVRYHSVIHEKPSHVCAACGKVFRHKSSLYQHVKIHKNERNYSCDVCGKRFIQKSNLVVHLRGHTGEKPFLCSVCGHGCRQSGDLKQHMILHSGIKPFGCELCGRKFAVKRDLETHMMRHGDERPFSCDQCDKTFKIRDDLKVHLKVHGGLKPYKCSMCDKAFLEKNNLKAHIRCHTGEKPYPCPNCGKCFSQSSSVNVHLKGSCKRKMSEK